MPIGGNPSGAGTVPSNVVEIRTLSDLPDPVLKDSVMTIILEDREYRLENDLSSSFPLAHPGAGNRATWKTVNRAIWTYTGTDSCWRDLDAEGEIELNGLCEFQAPNGNMWNLLAVTGSWSFQAVNLPRFTNCKALGRVDGGVSGNGAHNTFFGTYSNFGDGLVLANLFFNEQSTMFVFGNDNAKIDYDGQSVDFTLGETVTGGTSGATGVVEIDNDAGAAGTLIISSPTGTFVNDEVLTGSSTGVAVVNGVLQNTVYFTVEGTATTGAVNFLGDTFQHGVNETIFDINSEIAATIDSIGILACMEIGGQAGETFSSTGLNNKSLRVLSAGNTFIADSMVIGTSFVKNNVDETSIAVNDTFNDIDFGTLSAGSNIERFTLTNTVNGEMRYDGIRPFSGEIFMSYSASSMGGSQVFRTRFVKNGAVLTDDIETLVETGSNVASSTLQTPIELVNGDLIKPEVTRDAGTSTIIFQQYSVSVK